MLNFIIGAALAIGGLLYVQGNLPTTLKGAQTSAHALVSDACKAAR